jgi:hypothetical protein
MEHPLIQSCGIQCCTMDNFGIFLFCVKYTLHYVCDDILYEHITLLNVCIIRHMEKNMSYQERKTIAMIVSSVLIYLAYSLVLFLKYQNGDFLDINPLRLGAVILLLVIPLQIVAKIVTMILFTIGRGIAVQGDPDMPIEDERDKSIEEKAMKIAFYIFGAGFFLAMGSLALAWPLSIAFFLLFGSLFGSDIGSGIAQFRYYRRGF